MTHQGKPIVCFAVTKENLRDTLITAGKKVNDIATIVAELLTLRDECVGDWEIERTMLELSGRWTTTKHSRRLALDAQEDQQGRTALKCWRVAALNCTASAERVHSALIELGDEVKPLAGSERLDTISVLDGAETYTIAVSRYAAAQQAAGLAAELIERLKHAAWLVDSLLSVIPEKEGGEAAAISVPQGT